MNKHDKTVSPEPFVTVKEAARFLGLARGTLYNKVSAGEIPHYKRSGALRFRLSELEHWMQSETPDDAA